MDQPAPGKKLKEFLWSHGDFANVGAPEDQVAQFERQRGVRLPEDFRQYLITMNGTGHSYGYGILRFWELNEIRSLAEEVQGDLEPTLAVIQASYSSSIENGRDYYVFADFLDESQLYAIRVSPGGGSNEVVLLDGSQPLEVAQSFAQFVDLLISSPGKLRIALD